MVIGSETSVLNTDVMLSMMMTMFFVPRAIVLGGLTEPTLLPHNGQVIISGSSIAARTLVNSVVAHLADHLGNEAVSENYQLEPVLRTVRRHADISPSLSEVVQTQAGICAYKFDPNILGQAMPKSSTSVGYIFAPICDTGTYTCQTGPSPNLVENGLKQTVDEVPKSILMNRQSMLPRKLDENQLRLA
ncbi:hypothetical protein CSKR_112930 [Clonorchis sinensis]|uniref:Uncharacterized protein n=1 Tax=Clonorchis sinensis TaxID=79923 RepID=A0A3R7GVM3_CLOSI|nr:hypothetical protein CSKR_112930 [Clonorchis sinensis]